MKAVLKKVEFMGKVGVGIYINGDLSKFVVDAVGLLAEIKTLHIIGYEVKAEARK